MSEYAEIEVGRISLCWFKNYLNDELVNLFFSKNDLLIENDCNIDEDDEDAGTYTKYVYKTTVHCAKDRLDARGFGIKNFEKIFNERITQAVDYSAFLHHLRINYDEFDEKAKERIKKNVTFKKWKNAMSKIITYELVNGNIDQFTKGIDLAISTECDKVIYYSLLDVDVKSFYAINTDIIDFAYIYRLILENCSDEDEIVLDFSNLAFWEDDSIQKALSATENVQKTIVLVEGSSDKDILEFSMNHLFPHLADLFYFMDFDDEKGGKRDGGTSFVIKNIKTFYFSKIKCNFIAIFDNDAEGYSSTCILNTEIRKLPENFRVLLYPDIDLFKKYPTIAPNGVIVNDNINKKAASIELYLPDKIIKNEKGFYPIEWEDRRRIKKENGEEEALYQGVISHKNDIKKNFHKLKNKIAKGKEEFKEVEWSRMRKLLENIVFAFDKRD